MMSNSEASDLDEAYMLERKRVRQAPASEVGSHVFAAALHEASKVDNVTFHSSGLAIEQDMGCYNWSLPKLAEVYNREIVRLHDVPMLIISDLDPRFTLRFKK
ncbi:Transposon Ty3-I Gag-Pol polyprotein [Gossypium australe]|uniref:Transposon Ty3-I Gag-Pol polyprotein n=1 Tax=Gossypium australe TaxID=47621 RepID=A0A5B6WIY6_9ROSI|nr:Transposon Ty3-I Gag-Pol polyprotein [Gossypium australe]